MSLAGSAPSRGDPAHLVKYASVLQPLPETQGSEHSPSSCSGSVRAQASPHAGATCQPARSGSVFPPRSGSRSLGGCCGGWGAEEPGYPAVTPTTRGASCHGVPVFGPRMQRPLGRCPVSRQQALALLAGPSLLSLCPATAGPARGLGGPTARLPPAPEGSLLVCKGFEPEAAARWGLGGGPPAGQRQLWSPSAWPRVAGQLPCWPPQCASPSCLPGGDAGRLGADLRLLPLLSLPRGLGAGTSPRAAAPGP